MRIGGKKYTLSKFSYLTIGIISTGIIILLVYLIFFRVPKKDRVVSYINCNSHYTETVVEADVTRNISVGFNYEDKMLTNVITEVYYFKDKEEYNKMIEFINVESINNDIKPKYSFDDINATITLVITLNKKSDTFIKLPKLKNELITYYENEKMTCSS